MDINAKDKSGSKKAQTEKQGFFQSFIVKLFGNSNPEAERKRQLKNIAKAFSKTKFHSYYKPMTLEVMPSLAKLLYEIYKVSSSAQLMFRANPNNNFYKQRIINYFLTDKQLEIIGHFDQNKIIEVAKKAPVNKIESQLEHEFEQLNNEIDSEKIARIENLYKAYCVFKDFVSYDYYVILKKFGSAMIENNFGTVPEFIKLNAEYVVDDLKDFCVVAYAITDDSIIWNEFFNFLKQINSTEIMTLGNWKKVVAKIKAIQSSKAFELMLKHISGNPDYATVVPEHHSTIVENFFDKIQEEMHTGLTKIRSQQKESQAGQFVSQIFGNAELATLRNYVSGMNDGFAKKELNTYTYTEPLCYLKTFLLEYVKKDLRQYYDVVVIRGQWDAGLSAPFSNAYQELLKVSDAITRFDDDLNELGVTGSKIKNLMIKTAHDPGAENIINRLVSDSNEQARDFIISSTQFLITIGKIMKQLIEDYMKQKPVIVHNWRELDRYMDHPMKEFSVGIYKKIYLFVQLMQQFLQD